MATTKKKKAGGGFNGSQRPHPLQGGSFIAQLLFLWTYPMLFFGRHHDIEVSDVWEVPTQESVKHLEARVKKYSAKQQATNPTAPLRLWRLLFSLLWKRGALAALLYVVWCFSSALQPVLVKRIVNFLADPTRPTSDGVMLSVYLGLCMLLYNFTINHMFHHQFRNGIRLRTSLMAVMFNKAQNLAMSNGQNTGLLTNLVSNDTERMFEMQMFIHYTWASPIFVVVLVVLFYLEIGPAAVVGFALLLISIPIQALLGGYVGRTKHDMLKFTDSRTNLMSQIIMGMNVIKMYSWELAFASRLANQREQEVNKLAKIQYTRAMMRMVLFVLPSLVGAVTMAVYVALGNELTLATTFSALSYLNILRWPLLLIPLAFSLLGEGKTSISRMEAFLRQTDIPGKTNTTQQENNSNGSLQRTTTTTTTTTTHAETPPTSTSSTTSSTTTPHVDVKPPKGTILLDSDGSIHLGEDTYNWRLSSNATSSGCESDGGSSSSVVVVDEDADADVLSATTLHAITHSALTIEPGSLVILVGRVGAGKTALLLSLLNELWRDDGKSQQQQQQGGDGGCKVCYAQQVPVIYNMTVKENILFGTAYDEARFKAAVEGACLERDLEILQYGAETEIGEHGVNLSGGQKARVSFARCIYHSYNASAVLLDDPLSSVDVHVAGSMFEKGIDGCLRGHTRVVVMSSHQELAQDANYIIHVANGRIAHVERRNPHVKQPMSFVDNHQSSKTKCEDTAHTSCSESDTASNGHEVGVKDGTKGKKRLQRQLTVKETKKQGVVGLSVYKLYADCASVSPRLYKSDALMTSATQHGVDDSSMHTVDATSYYNWLREPAMYGVLLSCVVLVVYMIGHTVRVLADVWLTWWSADADPRSSAVPSTLMGESSRFWTDTLMLWVVLNVVFATVRSVFTTAMTVRASRYAHYAAALRILYAPMSYFQANPPGRILNRFSADLHKVDIFLSDFMFQFLDNIFVLITVVLLALVSLPWIALLLAPVFALIYFLQDMYRSTSREVLRLEAITKSPLYSLFSQVLLSRVTIRAFGVEQEMKQRVHAAIDQHMKVFMLAKAMERWISFTFNSIATLVTFSLCIIAVHLRDEVEPAILGLALVYCLQLMGFTSWTVKTFVNLENSMTSLERVGEIMDIDVEVDIPTSSSSSSSSSPTTTLAPSSTFTTAPVHKTITHNSNGNGNSSSSSGGSWPQKGGVEFVNVKLRYRPELHLALDNFNLHIRPGEKLGICGRTGAGKSSIIASLFRLFPCEGDSQILIDGVNIFDLPLQVSRSCLAIIPQDPVVINDTVRFNFDPYNQYSDEHMHSMLEKVELLNYLTTSYGPHFLDKTIGTSEGEVAFSYGQQQLFCIARALLRDCKVLACDEATSSVDKETDALIQNVLSHVFVDKTVIIVAHRLDTIMTCDRVLVMDAGHAVEIGDPKELIQTPASHFKKMIDKLQETQSDGSQITKINNTNTAHEEVQEKEEHQEESEKPKRRQTLIVSVV